MRVNNNVLLYGIVVEECKIVKEYSDRKLYSTILQISRLSDKADYIPVKFVLFNRMLDDAYIPEVGDWVHVDGSFQSRSIETPGKRNRLELYVFGSINKDGDSDEDNYVFIKGKLARPANYRVTPKGRDISDVYVIVDRGNKRSDYIPVVLWGELARKSELFDKGMEIEIEGRIQSRLYTKQLEDGRLAIKIAYEVSAKTVNL